MDPIVAPVIAKMNSTETGDNDCCTRKQYVKFCQFYSMLRTVWKVYSNNQSGQYNGDGYQLEMGFWNDWRSTKIFMCARMLQNENI